jgi:hypothetical protein
MDKKQGLGIIEQALQIANSKGAFKLEESSTIFTALTVVKNTLQESVESVESVEVKEELPKVKTK